MPKTLNQKRFINLLNSLDFGMPPSLSDSHIEGGTTVYSGKQNVVVNFLASNSYSDPAIDVVLDMKDPNFKICALSAPFLSVERFYKMVDILDQVHFFSVTNRAGLLQADHFRHLIDPERLRRALFKAIKLGILSTDSSERSSLMVLIAPMLLFMDSKNASANQELQAISRFLQQKETRD